MKITTLLLLLLLLLLLGFTSHSQCERMIKQYGTVISESDIIVEGEILEKTESGYKFKIIEFIKGKSSEFIDVNIGSYVCDVRIKKIIKGQRLILFLLKSNDSYKVINGSTGELFVDIGNSIKSHRKLSYRNPEFPNSNDLKKGVRLFLKAFELRKRIDKESGYFIKYFNPLITQNEIDKMKTKSIFFKIIAQNIPLYKNN